MSASLPALVLFLLAVVQTTAPPADLTVVQGHYATAAYEEALAHLGQLDPADITPELEQYRALCLMALGRADEGGQAFERLVRQAPMYVIPEAEVSPRMLRMFHDVRRRVLPVIVRDLFDRGKSSFEARNFDAAVVELGEVLRLLSDPQAAADATTFADLRQLASGFLRLSEAEIALAARAAEAAAAPPPPAPVETAVVPEVPGDGGLLVTKIVVYSRDDRNVVPPVEIDRFMPPWNPPAAMRFTSYRGELEVIVNETGRVEEGRMIRPTNPSYDLPLVGAARQWRFEPARLDGEPVKYRMTFEIVLTPRQ